MTDTTTSPTVRLDMWADIACPWCFIGQVKLDAAIQAERAAGRAVDVRHRPFQLNPSLPPSGVDAAEYFAPIFGGEQRMREAFARTEGIARDVGLAIDHASMTKAANTRYAHAVVLSYDGDPRQRAVLMAMYSAYFEQGRDITDHAVVHQVAAHASGESLDEVAARVGSFDLTALDASFALGRDLGVSAVPTFVADAGADVDPDVQLSAAAVAVQGAQDAATLQEVFAEARRRAGA
jgi:predicted DsbA family dithiol-disulfide isomerase